MKKQETYEILKIFEFSSDRKMMSIVVKNIDTKQILVFAKGADMAIIPRLKKDYQKQSHKHQEETLMHVDEFARRGYRTLVFGFKELYGVDEKEIMKDLMEESELESELEVLGITAVEDLL